MIGISRLWLGTPDRSEALRYGSQGSADPAGHGPVVVWNCTARCNLACRHCYAPDDGAGELSRAEGLALIDDLAGMRCPVLLLSGGEPMLRPDAPELADHAVRRGLRVVVSTNGTRIDAAAAGRLREAGVSYVGVSLDGLEKVHDAFRGVRGAFRAALAGLRTAAAAGLRTGVRLTLTRANLRELPGIFSLLRDEGIPRVCFYHLVPVGRGTGLGADAPSRDETRSAVDTIIEQTERLHADGIAAEVLTVDNPADGPYLYLRLRRAGNPRAADVLALLARRRAGQQGMRIACVGWDGTVYPDQFWRARPLGSVRERPLSSIWTDTSDPFLSALRRPARHVRGRCAACRFLELCGGGLRARAEAATGDPWASDPACYLTEGEIAGD